MSKIFLYLFSIGLLSIILLSYFSSNYAYSLEWGFYSSTPLGILLLFLLDNTKYTLWKDYILGLNSLGFDNVSFLIAFFISVYAFYCLYYIRAKKNDVFS